MTRNKTWFALKLFCAALTIIVALYGLITQNFSAAPVMFVFLGLMAIAMAFDERGKNRRGYFVLSMLTGLFALVVGLYTLIF